MDLSALLQMLQMLQMYSLRPELRWREGEEVAQRGGADDGGFEKGCQVPGREE